MPFLGPEIVLLYKAKHLRAHDQADFDHVHTTLSSERRHWLRQALAKCHPGHPWLAKL
ncbi:hypothetical protein LM602_02325 [Candidatus Acetothermia bacterium]|nr:hypothetical protein [Candidatus Acetothermia bacterium]MCI2431381.1 hypothetical protein [Candidatus Acetothermia bacterium]MCI2435829.1 hypothetical protein [Candidatus Acetothermia bacterium]